MGLEGERQFPGCRVKLVLPAAVFEMAGDMWAAPDEAGCDAFDMVFVP